MATTDAAVMAFALKFVNSAPKEKLIAELDVTDTIATKIIDQRDFGGYKNLDDILDKKLLRKKKFILFRDRLLAYSKDHKPADKHPDDDDDDQGQSGGAAKKGKKKAAAGRPTKDGAVVASTKHSFVETEPLVLRLGFLVKPTEPPVAELVHDLAPAEAY